MATFNSLTFDERGAGGGRDFPAHGAKYEIAVFVIPGGSPTIQPIGDAAAEFTVPAQGTEAELDALRGAVGTSATLEYVGGSVTARLREVSNATKVLDSAGVWQWSLAFLR
jgi:hypothetical protein